LHSPNAFLAYADRFIDAAATRIIHANNEIDMSSGYYFIIFYIFLLTNAPPPNYF